MAIPNVYTATEDPTSQVGNDGDIYFHTGLSNAINVYRKTNRNWSRIGTITTDVGGNPGSIADQQIAFGNGTAITGSDKLKWNGQGLLLQDDATLHNVFIGFQENPFGPISGINNVGVGVDIMDTLTTGSNNVSVGFNSGSTFDTASDNTCIGANAEAENDSSSVTTVGSGAIGNAVGAVAIGAAAKADGINSVAIGTAAHAYTDSTMVLGLYQAITDIYCGFRVSNSSSNANIHASTFFGDGSGLTSLDSTQIIFPDSDPHIAGAGYWLAGVLTRSSG